MDSRKSLWKRKKEYEIYYHKQELNFFYHKDIEKKKGTHDQKIANFKQRLEIYKS